MNKLVANQVDRNLPEGQLDAYPYPETLWTVEDVAQYLRIQPATVREMAKRFELPAVKVGRMWRFKPDRIKEWVGDREIIIHDKKLSE